MQKNTNTRTYYLISFFFVKGSIKYKTLLISLAKKNKNKKNKIKQKQSDHKQIIPWQFHIGSLSSQVAFVETLKAIMHSGHDLCW